MLFRLRSAPLTLALSLALILALAPPLARAQAQPATNDAAHTREFHIEAGPLAAALARFSAQSGWGVSADAALTEGQRSPGLSGNFNDAQALRRLLAGTGLQWRQIATGSVVLVRPAPVNALEPVTVTASRSGKALGQTAQKVTVITREALQAQLAVNSDPSQVLSNLIPNYSPSRQKLTSWGESFRGRAPLFMIDGVPQSNPLRPGSRDSNTIDLSMVERIEVIHGASAEHGLGATGGIINFVTRRPEGGKLSQHAGISASAPTDYDHEGLGYKADYRVEGLNGDWDYLAALSYQSRGVAYDAKGRAVGIDNSQGDLMDTQSYDLLLKAGYWFDDNQNLQVTLNRFSLEGNQDYVTVDGDRATGQPTTSEKGHPEGKATSNQVLTTSVNYRHLNLAGNDLQAQLYLQRFRARFGGDRSAVYQDTSIAPAGTLFDQSENRSDKIGGKITVNRDGMLNGRLKLTSGLDVLQDTTRQTQLYTNRDWVPETRFRNIAPFLQSQFQVVPRLSVQAGVRYEYAKLDVDDFTTLASYGDGAQGNRVEGGTPSFDATLYNAGLTYQISEPLQLFANYSEGFGMPDVGRALRSITSPGLRVDDFLDLRPVDTDNREIGLRFNHDPVTFELSYFESDSDRGSILVQRNGVYELRRQKTEIHGAEADINWQVLERHRIGASYSHVTGRYDSDQDGHLDADLTPVNVSPDKLTLRWHAAWNDRFDSQLSGHHYFSRSFDNANHFEGYNLVDLALGYKLARGRITAGVENLFNEDYFSYFSQSATTLSYQYFKGRGRLLTLGYSLDF
ncbi:TonB-dependent receptor domain-containing protein [Alloalcanivorax marinus]|uniref:TonB-dependent receptor domain-containing protein n=1 Tax=Alloalcanivorax marinus TaxID=1177169 RepID=UPI00193137DA|nr:TonB-dependent receptor [Alloalcanivorax marinus]MBL7250322.1 TonB-dependent receptor [Alloalcanivorax marinus]